MEKDAKKKEPDLKQKIAAAREAEASMSKRKAEPRKSNNLSDIEVLDRIVQKYPLTRVEKRIITKVISLLETNKTKCMLPKMNVGDSVFKMYDSDEEPTEFEVDRIEFDDFGWKLISYEKVGTHEIEFIFCEKDYNKLFFDTAEQAKNYYKK